MTERAAPAPPVAGTQVLAGDLGGTKTVLGIFRIEGSELRSQFEEIFPSDPACRPEERIRLFIERHDATVASVCIGVAGPVIDGAVGATNLPWRLDQAELARALGVPRTRLINDLVANAHGVEEIPAARRVRLQEGIGRDGPSALLSPGTGLGEAIFLRRDGAWLVLPTEAGHADLAPIDDGDIELLQALWSRYGHASVERFLSGPGLRELYSSLGRLRRATPDPAVTARIAAAADPPAAISAAALAGECPLCELALDRFVRLLGAEAGNLALRGLSTGGVFLGGGIVPKIRPALEDGRFLEAFRAKGRLGRLLETIPVTLLLEPRAALLGAARMAEQILLYE